MDDAFMDIIPNFFFFLKHPLQATNLMQNIIEQKKRRMGEKRKIKIKKGTHVDAVRHKKLAFDKDIENGPSQNRGCTDIICCLIFLVFLGAYFFTFGYGVTNGNPWLLMTPFDTDGKGCGYDAGYENAKYIYFWRLTDYKAIADGSFYKETFCVESCPIYTDPTTSVENSITFKELNIPCKDTESSKAANGCENQKGIPSGIWFNHFCLPKYEWMAKYKDQFEAAFTGIFQKMEEVDLIRGWVNDVKVTWWIIFICFAFTLVSCFLYLYFLRCCADILTWLMILSFITIIIGLGAALIYYANNLAKQYTEAQDVSSADMSKTSDYYTKTVKYTGYGFVALGIIIALIILCICHKIRLVTAIIEATAEYVQDNMLILSVPIINMLLALIFMGVWIVGTIYLYSCGEIFKRGDYPFANVTWNQNTRYMWYFNMFAILWIVAFFISSGDFIIGASCCIWYYNQGGNSSEKKEEKNVAKSSYPIYTAYRWLYTKHLGSIALGSFLLAVVWAVRLIMAYIHKKLKDVGATKNKLVECLMNVIHCFLACFERFIRFVNKQAFIYIGLTGKNFCTSMLNAFQVVFRHPIEFALLAGLGHLFMYLGMAVMILSSVSLGYVMMTQIESIDSQITSVLVPSILIIILSYPVADLFFDVYMVACYAILHCYFVDLKLCEQSGSSAKHAPKALRAFLAQEASESEYKSVSDSFDSIEEFKKQKQDIKTQKKEAYKEK